MEFKEYRKRENIKQADVARLLNLTQGGYSRKEANPDQFKPSELLLISKEYKLSIEQVYEYFNILE